MGGRRRAPSSTNWSELPPEVLSSIAKRLHSPIDFFHFRSVCNNWRNPNPNLLSSFLPLQISNPTLPFSTRPNDTIILVPRTVLLVKSPDQQSQWILTVEEFNPGKLRILYPLSKTRFTNVPSDFPKYISFLEFDVFEVSKGYGFRYSSDESDVGGVDKVVLCSDSCTAMVLYGKGILVGVRLETGNWVNVGQDLVCAISDVINYEDMIYAVDYKGNLHVVDHKTMKVIKSIVVKSTPCKSIRRYLVESKGELCSFHWESLRSRLESLDERNGSWKYTSGPDSAILFISSHSSYSLNIAPRYESVVYSEHCLDSCGNLHYTKNNKLFRAANEELQLCIYPGNHGGVKTKSDTIKSIGSMLWPPPAWFWPDTYSSSEDEEEEDADSYNQQICGKELPPSLVVGNSTVRNIPSPSASNNMQGVEQGQLSSFDHNASGMTFEGLNIKPSLVPTLLKICSKHGNVMEECTFQNKDMISRALESLAEVVLILMGNTGQSLSETQADYITSALSDLQQMNFKVDWLIPFVQKALAVHKTRALVGSLKEFGKAKAQAEEARLKVLDELAKLDEAEGDLALVLEAIPALEEVDLNKCLGEGLS